LYKTFASRYKNVYKAPPTGCSAFPVDPRRADSCDLSPPYGSSRRHRAPRPKARLNVGLGRARGEPQRRWIGRSEGAEVHFAVADHPGADIAVFTTRPDTLMGVTYIVLAPEHALISEVTTLEHRAEVRAYVEAAARKSDLDRIAGTTQKKGVPTGAFALHPITGTRVPIWSPTMSSAATAPAG
jgi:hypothetical protein